MCIRDRDAAAQLERVVQGFHTRCVLGEVVMPEVGRTGACGHDQAVVWRLLRAARSPGRYRPGLDVDVDHLTEPHLGIALSTKDFPRRRGDRTFGEDPGGHYPVATGILSEGAIAPPTLEILRVQRNAQVRLGEVIDIDIESKIVTSWTPRGTQETPYDSLIVAAGSSASYFGHNYFAEHAPGMKSLDDALELRGRILSAFEFAEIETEADATAPWLAFVVVGAGPTGVEMAGQIAELAHRTLRKDYRRIDPQQARVVLLEGAPTVLGTFGEHLAAKATKKLEQLGVEVQLGAVVVEVDEYGIEV